MGTISYQFYVLRSLLHLIDLPTVKIVIVHDVHTVKRKCIFAVADPGKVVEGPDSPLDQYIYVQKRDDSLFYLAINPPSQMLNAGHACDLI